jgi:hypothetical protein
MVALRVAITSTGAGCGYRAVYAGAGQKMAVVAGEMLVPDVNAAQAALSGARAELAASGRLASGSAYPRLAIDVLRVDEVSRGIHVQSGQPVATGMGVAVVVRGRLQITAEQEPAVDTGDIRRSAELAGNADPRADSAVFAQAVRAAAERAGHAAARVAVGIPEPDDEGP